jgi:hypothetical protein
VDMPMWDDQIDRAIDEVAQAMTSGEPGADLRARVIARIDATEPRGIGAWRPALRLRSGLAVAGLSIAAMLLIATVSYRVMVRLKPDTTTTTATTAPTPSPTANAPAPVAQAFRPARGGTARPPGVAMQIAQGGPKRTAPYSPRRMTIAPSDVDALAPPPLAVDSIELGDIATESSIDIVPLDTIAPIAVPPLGEGDRP